MYLGIGPSAHSYNGIQRSWNVSNNAKYLKSLSSDIVPQEIEELSVKDKFNETVMTGLRTIWGVTLNEIESDFGVEYKENLLKNSEEFINQQLLEIVTINCSDREIIEKLKITKK